jgi:hypothetical protein
VTAGHHRLTRQRETALAAVAYVLLAVAVWWPLPARAATTTIAPAIGDPLVLAWTLAWGADRILHGFSQFWTGLFFYPYPDTVAYSEHLLGITVFTAPVQWLTGNPILAFNLAMIGSTALAGFGMFLLARDLTGRADAAFVAGVAFACAPYRVAQLYHLQVLVSGWMPIALYGLHRFLATRSTRALVLFVIAFVLQAWSNGYFLYFMAPPVAIITLHALWRDRDAAAYLVRRLTLAAMAILLALAPVAWAYVRVRREQGLARSPDDILLFAPPLEAYAHVNEHVWFWGELLPLGRQEQELFPGLLIVLLAAAGAWLTTQRTAPAAPPSPTAAPLTTSAGLYVAIAGIMLVLSLGPRPSAFGWQLPVPGPYVWLSAVLPGMDGLRVIARMATVVYLAIGVLGAIGFAVLTRRLGPPSRRVVTVVTALLIAGEGYRGPLPVEAFPTSEMKADQPAYEWLRTQPRGPLLELPVEGTWHAARHLFRTLEHGNRIVNGYSSYGSALQDFVGGPPFTEVARIDDALQMARALGLRWIVVHPPLYTYPEAGAAIATAIREATAHVARSMDFGPAVVVELRPLDMPTAAPIDPTWRELGADAFTASASHLPGDIHRALDGDRATRWITGERQQGREWIELRFPAAVDVARVRLEMDARSYGDYPRGLVVEGSPDGEQWQTLFEGGILPHLALSIAHESRASGIDVRLPANATRVLRLRNTGETRVWFWSVHQLRVWAR